MRVLPILMLLLTPLLGWSQQQEKTDKMKLIYIMDPQCGWCYANGKNIAAIKEKYAKSFDFELLVGGMWLGADAPVGGESFANFIEVNGGRLTEVTGAPFGQAFLEMCKDSTYTFSSLEGAAAIVWALQQDEDKGFLLAKAIQDDFYLEGKRYDIEATYKAIIQSLGLDFEAFQKDWMSPQNIENTKAVSYTHLTLPTTPYV